MKLLNWIKNRGKEPEGESAQNPHATEDGKPIKQLWRSDWYSDDHGLREFRHHVGRSEHGFHGGLEISYRGGEGPFKWGEPKPTKADAEMASYGMRDGCELESSWRDGTYEQPKDKQPEGRARKTMEGIER